MTNFEAIKREMLKKINVNAIAKTMSESTCKECICRTYCDNYRGNGGCRRIIKDWLKEEVEE